MRYFSLISLLFFPALAWADEVTSDIDLVCDKAANLALVRFPTSDGGASTFALLPKELDHGLSASPHPSGTECALGNGTTIRVRGGRDQAFPYGAGGGNPPNFFSLWVNQRKVISREVWKPGYEETYGELPTYDGVLIAAKHITICATAEGNPQRCTSRPLDLAKAPIDRVEYASGGQRVPGGNISVIAKGAANYRFCQDYLSRSNRAAGALRGERTSLDIDLEAFTGQTGSDRDEARSGLVDLAPGAGRRLWIWESETHYFDGTVIAIGAPDLPSKNIAKAYPFEDIDSWPERSAPQGVTLISGGQKQLYPKVSPRYVHLVPQAIDGELYVFAYPTNNEVRPTAALVKPLAKGGFVTLCAFNRTKPHF